jgi:hypothetical protein
MMTLIVRLIEVTIFDRKMSNMTNIDFSFC